MTGKTLVVTSTGWVTTGATSIHTAKDMSRDTAARMEATAIDTETVTTSAGTIATTGDRRQELVE
jgi:hypothetical protein